MLTGCVRVAFLLLRFSRTKSLLDRLQKRPIPRLVARKQCLRRIARLVEAASHMIPGGRHCLTRAMVLELFLRRRGHDAQVKIGVARDDSGKLIAHAWLHCEGIVLIGGEGAANYVEVSAPASRSLR
jgi:hypothetical protein